MDRVDGAVRHISGWTPGEPPAVPRDGGDTSAPIRWFDVDGSAGADAIVVRLGPLCDGLTHDMVVDLVTPDEEPEGKRYGAGRVRLASSFAVRIKKGEEGSERGRGGGVGLLVFEPVELLAGDGWLLTCWHEARPFHGVERLRAGICPAFPDDLFARVGKRWASGTGETAGDLGTMVMHELALTYGPAHRQLYTWLEDWELALYTDNEVVDDALTELWGLMAVMRDWLNALNLTGVRADLDKAWLPATNHQDVVDVDERIDRALVALRDLGANLRSAFNLLHIHREQRQRERSERLQQRVGVIAAVFLIPTLIVGFYGANTWVPGQGQHWGFWVMVAVLVGFTVAGALMIHRWNRQQQEDLLRAKAERLELRSRLHETLAEPSEPLPATADP